jgi:hypothetical protein
LKEESAGTGGHRIDRTMNFQPEFDVSEDAGNNPVPSGLT